MNNHQGIVRAVGLAVRADSDVEICRQLDLAEDTGYNAVELCITACRVIANGRLSNVRKQKFLKILRDRNLIYTVHVPLILNFMDEEHIELHMDTCRASLEFCNEIGSGVLVIHPGWIDSSRMLTSLDRLRSVEAKAIRCFADLGSEYGVLLAMENMPAILGMITAQQDNYGLDPTLLAEQIDAIHHPNVCGTLDFSHALISANYFGVDYLEFIEPFMEFVNHLHGHDSFGRPPSLRDADGSERLAYGMGDLHLPLGWGSIPWESILPEIRIRPDSVMIVEISDEYVDSGTVADSLERARFYAGLIDQVAAEEETFAAA